MKLSKSCVAAALVLGSVLAVTSAHAQKKYGPGASDTEIKIGQTIPYSGPASAYGTIGKAEAAYFQWINDQGGVNGRKITFVSLDDGYNPAKTVEQTRRLVEQEEVLLLFQSLGTPTNSAIHKYVNAKKVPHILLATGATKWSDPKNFPWTMGFNPTYQSEGRIYAQYILKNHPNAKLAVLYQNDDFGKDYVIGLKSVLGDKAASMIVKEVTYEVTDPTIDSQVVALKASGADTLLTFATPKFAAQTIRKVSEIGWKPLHILTNVSASVGAVLTPAGLDKSKDIVTAAYLADPTEPEVRKEAAFKVWENWMKKYYPAGDPNDQLNLYGYAAAASLVHILKACGDDLSRENVMKVAANLKDVEIPMLLPGIRLNTSANDFGPIAEMRLAKFDGTRWVLFGDLLSGR
ncbi:MAG: ABC transporter substrate-binding protein [Burkholderiales bacterium]|nr:ABC transporter substrate-binding protein [Burkholderiales bacterium]